MRQAEDETCSSSADAEGFAVGVLDLQAILEGGKKGRIIVIKKMVALTESFEQ